MLLQNVVVAYRRQVTTVVHDRAFAVMKRIYIYYWYSLQYMVKMIELQVILII